MKRFLIFLIVLLPMSVLADTWDDTEIFSGGMSIYSFEAADGTGNSNDLKATGCGTLVFGFEPATGGAADVYSCKGPHMAVSACTKVLTLNTQTDGNIINTAKGYVRITRTAAPTSGTAQVFVYCAEQVGRNPASGGSAHVIQDEGVALPQQTALDFTGAGVTCSDGTGKTVCDVTSGSGGHTIQDGAGTPLTQRNTLQFKGRAVTTDDSIGLRTVVDVPAETDPIATSNLNTHAADPNAHHTPPTVPATVEAHTTAGASGSAPVAGAGGVLAMTDVATQAELDSHAANANAHHVPPTVPATVEMHSTSGLSGTAPVSDGAGTLTMTDVATQAELDAHVNAASGAHAASAVSNAPSGGIAAADVQAAINELDSEKEPSISTGAANTFYNGTKTFQQINSNLVINTPAGGISANDVQAAVNELDTEKAPLDSPALTGTPTASTPPAADNTTRIATSAFVQGEISTGKALKATTLQGANDSLDHFCIPDVSAAGTTTNGIQECINALYSQGGGTVLLGPRTYLIGANTILVDTQDATCQSSGGGACEIRFVGAGRGATFVKCNTGCTSSTTAAVFTIRQTNVTFSDLTIIAQSSGVIGVLLDKNVGLSGSGNNTVMANVNIDSDGADSPGSRTGSGIEIRGGELTGIHDVGIRFFQDGILLSGTNLRANQNPLRGINISDVDVGIHVPAAAVLNGISCGARHVDVSDSSFQSIAKYGIWIEAGAGGTDHCGNVRVEHSWFESLVNGIRVQTITGVPSANVVSLNNNFSTTKECTAGGNIGLTCTVDTDCAPTGGVCSESDAVLLDVDTDGYIYSVADRINATNCLKSSGTGTVYWGWPQSSGCSPVATKVVDLTVGGSPPGGSQDEVQVNNGSGGFGSVVNGTAGQVLTSNASGPPTFQDNISTAQLAFQQDAAEVCGGATPGPGCTYDTLNMLSGFTNCSPDATIAGQLNCSAGTSVMTNTSPVADSQLSGQVPLLNLDNTWPSGGVQTDAGTRVIDSVTGKLQMDGKFSGSRMNEWVSDDSTIVSRLNFPNLDNAQSNKRRSRSELDEEFFVFTSSTDPAGDGVSIHTTTLAITFPDSLARSLFIFGFALDRSKLGTCVLFDGATLNHYEIDIVSKATTTTANLMYTDPTTGVLTDVTDGAPFVWGTNGITLTCKYSVHVEGMP